MHVETSQSEADFSDGRTLDDQPQVSSGQIEIWELYQHSLIVTRLVGSLSKVSSHLHNTLCRLINQEEDVVIAFRGKFITVTIPCIVHMEFNSIATRTMDMT